MYCWCNSKRKHPVGSTEMYGTAHHWTLIQHITQYPSLHTGTVTASELSSWKIVKCSWSLGGGQCWDI